MVILHLGNVIAADEVSDLRTLKLVSQLLRL